MSGSRSRNPLDSFFDALEERLVHAPLWVGPCVATTIFVVFYSVIPFLLSYFDSKVIVLWQDVFRFAAWIFTFTALVAWVSAMVIGKRDNRRLNANTELASIRELSWQEFERLLAAAYRKKGFIVTMRGGPQGDGGVDLELQSAGAKTLVQCKRWKKWRVGAPILRELYGAMHAEGAVRGALVTCGRFTKPAQEFAEGKPIDLIDGEQLVELIQTVQGEAKASNPTPAAVTTPEQPASVPMCPTCGAAMVRRTARRGRHAGHDFWACPTFPKCRGKRAIA